MPASIKDQTLDRRFDLQEVVWGARIWDHGRVLVVAVTVATYCRDEVSSLLITAWERDYSNVDLDR
jgi:hypothetical protein